MQISQLISQLSVAVPSIIIGTQTLTSIINGLFKIDNNTVRHLVSWIIAVLVSLGFVLAGEMSFGFDNAWKEYLVGSVAGVLAGGAANGFYDWDAIGSMFKSLEKSVRREKKAEMLND